MNIARLLLLALAAALISAPSWAFDPENGAQLVNENCFECHDTSMYTRADRRVTSRNGLTKQVRRCELSLGLQWFDDEVGDAAEYLNRQFYKFGK